MRRASPAPFPGRPGTRRGVAAGRGAGVMPSHADRVLGRRDAALAGTREALRETIEHGNRGPQPAAIRPWRAAHDVGP